MADISTDSLILIKAAAWFERAEWFRASKLLGVFKIVGEGASATGGALARLPLDHALEGLSKVTCHKRQFVVTQYFI